MPLFGLGKRRVGLALGGGAARGMAHLGVIKALTDHRIPIDFVAGTSAGSIVGGLYAAGVPIDEMITHVKSLRWKHIIGFSFSLKGMVSSRRLEKYLRKILGRDLTFGELKTPFCALSTDIMTGRPVELKDAQMSLATALRASSCFPGIHIPVELGGKYLVDGGTSSNVPISTVKKLGANYIIAVDVIPNVRIDHVPKNLALIVDRSLDLLLHRTSHNAYKGANMVLSPITEYIHSFEMDKADQLIQLGIDIVEQNLPKLKRLRRD